MEIQYFGGNCVKITTKKASIVIDDNLKELGASSIAKPTDIQLFTTRLNNSPPESRLSVDGPGEYEVANVSISGIAARAHIDEEKTKNATVYKVVVDDIRIVAVGHIYPELSEDQLESIGTIDVLLVPVGGHGFTLDTVGALKVIKEINPKIIIPTYYSDSKLNYPVPAIDKAEAIKGLLMEPKETTAKLKLKAADFLADQPQLIILERQ
jgi:L-ascorbate metabolism protein UlaG (beta-lactamase superfamily)